MRVVNENHPSIRAIQENCRVESITDDFIVKQIDKINTHKATGMGDISVKVLKIAKPAIVKSITNLINMSFSKSKFPNQLKIALYIRKIVN